MQNTLLFSEGPADRIRIDAIPAINESINVTERWLVERWQTEPFFVGRCDILADGPFTQVGTIVTMTFGTTTRTAQVTAYGDYVDPTSGNLGPKTVTMTRLT